MGNIVDIKEAVTQKNDGLCPEFEKFSYSDALDRWGANGADSWCDELIAVEDELALLEAC